MKSLTAITPAQREVILAAMLYPESALGNIGGQGRIVGPLDSQACIACINAIVEQHDVFALGFEIEGSEIHHCSVDRSAARAQFFDFSEVDEALPKALQWTMQKFRERFDLNAKQSLIRFYLLRLSQNEHVLVVYGHHALLDAWAIALLIQRISRALHAMHTTGVPLSIEAPRFLDATASHLTWLDSDAYQRSLSYWQQRFPQPPENLFPPIKPFQIQADLLERSIPWTQFERWQEFAQAQGHSLAALLSAALSASLAFHCGVKRPVLGLPVHGRNTAQQKETVGLFANILPLAVEVEPSETLLELATRVTKQQRADYRHARLTPNEIARTWNLQDVNYDFIEATLSVESYDYSDFGQGCKNDAIGFSVNQQRRPLQLYLRQYCHGLPVEIAFCFNPSFLTEQSASRLLDAWLTCLERAVQDPATPLALASKLTTPTATPLPTLMADSLWQAFTQQAALTPDAIALSDGADAAAALSYRELHSKAAAVGATLRAQGVVAESRIGLAAERNQNMLLGLLGILAAGACYVPLDPRYPQERLQYLVQDAALDMVLADADGMAALSPLALPALRLLSLDDLFTGLELQQAMPAQPAHPDQAAYIIYTSGSTGQPKGCLVSHRNVLSLVGSATQLHGYHAADAWTMFHSYSFDFSVWEIWGALLTGGRLLIVPYVTSRDPEAFYQMLATEQVSVLSQTPTAFRSLLAVDDALQELGQAPQLALRRVIFGGEALEPAMLSAWYAHHGDATEFINMYGITETTVHVSNRVLSADDLRQGSVIGEALPGWRMYLLDADLQEVAPGQTGELYIGGAGITRGYWQRPALSATRFLPDPFANDGSRMYRSGDLARRRLDGELEYLGRADQQVKIRGYRIELGEIEAALMSHEAVQSAIVLAVADDTPGAPQRLLAWLTPKNLTQTLATPEQTTVPLVSAPPLSDLALREWLQTRLPQHMVPARILWISKIPLTTNGKLDRALLPMPEAKAVAQPADTGKLSATEALLASIWQEVLACQTLSRDDNFFALGGDSIMALKVIGAARKQGLALDLALLFRTPTLAALAAELDALGKATNPAAKLATPSLNVDTSHDIALPIASLQAGMLFHTELEEGNSVFLDVFSYQLRMQWDQPRFATALARLGADVAALRTSFDWGHGAMPAQIIASTVTLPLEVIDLRGIDSAIQGNMLDAFMLAERGRLFDISRAPLMRFTVHLLDADNLRLSCALHHAIVDGWSFATLITRLLSSYLDPKRILPPSPSLQELHVMREQAAVNDPAMREFWHDYTKVLSSHQHFERLASDEKKAPVRCRIPIHHSLLKAARKLAQKAQVSMKTVLLGAHILALAEITASDTVCTGYVTHCRPEVENAEQGIGLFLNTLPLAIAVQPDQTLFQWIQSLAREETRVLAQRWMPLLEIKKLNQGQLPFSASFNFVNFHAYQGLLDQQALQVEALEVFEQTDFPLLAQFAIDPRDQGLELTLFAQCAAIDWDELNRMALIYLACLAVVVGADPELLQDEAIALPSKLAQDTLLLSRELMPAPEVNSASPAGNGYYAPRATNVGSAEHAWSSLESALLPLWQESLNCTEIGPHDSYFALGGDSISGTRLVTLVRAKFACQLPLRAFLLAPSIAGMAAAIAAAQTEISSAPAIPKTRRKFSEKS